MMVASRLHRRQTPAPPDRAGTSRRGDLAMAIPHHRSMYLTTFVMRVVSILLSAAILSLVASLDKGIETGDHMIYAWSFVSPTAAMAAAWSFVDIVVLLIKDRGLVWRQSDRREQSRLRREPASAFCWGPPAIHLCVHLAIWLVTTILTAMIWLMWFGALESALPGSVNLYYYSSAENIRNTLDPRTLWVIATLQIPLILIHFVLFVMACVAADDRARKYSDIVFVPKDNGNGDIVTALPSALWSLFKPQNLPMAVSVNQYVRFVPVEDGTVRAARQDAQREP